MCRWVLGPSPGNENGWAFCESDAPTPHEVHASWISWDGFEWHSSPSLRFVEPSPPGVEDEESDYEEETALEARFVNEQGEGQLGGAWQEAPPPRVTEKAHTSNGAARLVPARLVLVRLMQNEDGTQLRGGGPRTEDIRAAAVGRACASLCDLTLVAPICVYQRVHAVTRVSSRLPLRS